MALASRAGWIRTKASSTTITTTTLKNVKPGVGIIPRPADNLRSIKDENSTEGGYVYRYRDLVGERAEWVRQIIVDSQLYFAAPKMLNDPFDCQPRFKIDDRS